MRWIKQIFLPARFFILFSAVIVIMALGFVMEALINVSLILLALYVLTIIADLSILFAKNHPLTCTRKASEVLSLGDENQVLLSIEVHQNLLAKYQLIDELPVQLQERNFLISGKIDAKKEPFTIQYKITPLTRGEYNFGNVNIFIHSTLGLLTRKVVCASHQTCKVFPSVIQLKKYEIIALSSASLATGMKSIRRIGHSYEFDQIKGYVFGDDSRSINWKASGRKGSLMVNQYEDERSQQIFCIVDNSRLMQKPFNGMSMLDYAINTTLSLSNIILKKHDKAGLITFAKKINTFLLPNNGNNQLHKIYHSLYNEKTSLFEANYEQLHYAIKTTVTNRSLLFLFTNFDTPENLVDVLPILRKINRNHLLVVVFFEDAELHVLAQKESKTVFDVYEQTILRKLINEKEQIIRELQKHGIQTFKTKPENLSMQTIQKYFELKSRGLI